MIKHVAALDMENWIEVFLFFFNCVCACLGYFVLGGKRGKNWKENNWKYEDISKQI